MPDEDHDHDRDEEHRPHPMMAILGGFGPDPEEAKRLQLLSTNYKHEAVPAVR